MTTDIEKVEKKSILFPKPLPPEVFLSIFKSLNKLFPNCFSLAEVKILKKGIRGDIFNHLATLKLSKKKVTLFLIQYALTPEYVARHVEQAKRYDLEGNEDGFISKQECEVKTEQYKAYLKFINKLEKKQQENSQKNQ